MISRRTSIITISLILMSLVLISCGRGKQQRLAVAYVIDMTASVDSEAISQAFAGLQPLLNSKTLRRGDTINIIPITGDTLTESQGRVVRIHLPENREVYDADLARLAEEVKQKLEGMQAGATANPYQHSDILGAADLAAEELSVEKGNVRRVIVILSDFIQDDTKFNFNTSTEVANDNVAANLARKLSAKHANEFAGATVYLGMLRSKDLKKMPNARREAVQTFWREYFKAGSASGVSLATDGPGKIGSAIERL